MKNEFILYTIGYEGRKIDEFVVNLKSSHVKMLIDVRELPLSRKKGFSKNKLKEKLEKELSTADISTPQVPVIANASAAFVCQPEQILASLAAQLTNPVLWQKSMEKLIDEGVTTFVEIGCGKVLRGLIRKINREVTVIGVENMETLNQTVEMLSS